MHTDKAAVHNLQRTIHAVLRRCNHLLVQTGKSKFRLFLFSMVRPPIVLMVFGLLVASLAKIDIIKPMPFWLHVASVVLGVLMTVYGIILWGTSICHFHLPHDYDGGPGDKRDTM